MRPDLALPIIRGDEKEVMRGGAFYAEREVQHPQNAGVDAGRMLDLDLPPLKWSSLKYVFRMEDKIDGKEEAYG